jgi:hypothetical protein
MKSVVLAFMLLAGVAGCDNTGADVVPLSGTYIGYFHRSGKDTARVTLRFEDNRFDGSSNKDAYPAISSGLFRQSENTVSFISPFNMPPSLDSSLVLKGEYNYLYHDDGTIRIWKSSEEAEDEFILKVYLGETVSHTAKARQGSASGNLE